MESVQYTAGQVLPGTVYRVIRHLATGGMGSVYEVEDVTVEKRYVLKTLHPQLVSREDLARRMRDEAKALAKLNHPNIVDVITAGVTTDPTKMPFYVMERLNGQNLRVLLQKKGSLDLVHCYRIAIDVLDALEHAHEHKIVHRDVKPENIYLHRNLNGVTTTKLLDFGIVRILDRKASHTHGKFIGTLRYASPEQVMGETLGPASDIYSLGTVLYEMLCGRGPFDDAGDAYAIGAAHAQKPAPPLSMFAPSVPQVLERLVMQAIAKAPNDRPRDCFTLASDLRRLLREEEAAPKSMTAVNMLTSGSPPDTRLRDPSADPFTRTEASPGLEGESGESLASRGTFREPSGAAREPLPPTLAAAGGAQAPENAPVNGIDRSAPTRPAPVLGSTQRIAPNDTRMEAEMAGPGTPQLRAPAAGRPAEQSGVAAPYRHESSVGQAPVGHAPPLSDSGELLFAPMNGVSPTGPTAGESQTRPPEKSPFFPLVLAAVVALGMIGTALVVVAKPWNRGAGGATSASPSASAPLATPAPVLLPPAASVASVSLASATPPPPVAVTVASTTSVVTNPKPLPRGGAGGGPHPPPRPPPPTPATAAPAVTTAPPKPASSKPAAHVPGFDD